MVTCQAAERSLRPGGHLADRRRRSDGGRSPSAETVYEGNDRRQERARERDVTLETGTRLGPYEIRERIGAGGMGVVFRALDTRLRRDVAIKILPPGVDFEGAHARFERERLALAKLSHPNIATLFDVGEQDGVSYLVMEYVAGQSLAARLAEGPLPVDDAITLASEIAHALAEAHEQGIVHRDLKPANVVVTQKGHAKVLDFGIAKLLEPMDAGGEHSATTETR